MRKFTGTDWFKVPEVARPGCVLVVDAIASGKRAARVIERYLRGEALAAPDQPPRPEVYVAPVEVAPESQRAKRVAVPRVAAAARDFGEAELSLAADEAVREASRCLRCDLEFTRAEQSRANGAATSRERARC
jgi:hypothetical protein